MRKVTIQDIAGALGMSRNTVAKAFNGGRLAPETRQEIILKAKEMGYSKLNPILYEEVAAGCLPKGTILVLFNRSQSFFWQQILTGVSREIMESGYRMQLLIAEDAGGSAASCLKQAAEDTKGILCLCVFPMVFVKELVQYGLPITFFGAPRQYTEYLKYGDIVTFEGRSAMYDLIRTVIRMGKKTFAFIGPVRANREIYERYCGYADALEESKINRKEQPRMTEDAPDNFYSYARVEQFINSLEKIPEVIVCSNDDIARFAAGALFSRNPKLVKKTVITGFDKTVEEGFLKPDILTVEVKKEEAGRRMIRTLLQRIAYPDMDYAMISLATYPCYEMIQDTKQKKGGC